MLPWFPQGTKPSAHFMSPYSFFSGLLADKNCNLPSFHIPSSLEFVPWLWGGLVMPFYSLYRSHWSHMEYCYTCSLHRRSSSRTRQSSRTLLKYRGMYGCIPDQDGKSDNSLTLWQLYQWTAAQASRGLLAEQLLCRYDLSDLAAEQATSFHLLWVGTWHTLLWSVCHKPCWSVVPIV